ncbi:uncharacterized protein LOC121628035 [Melanotaenia boesemani]|uniref:uncharacterized protein LOC121628035 n=1 Tax=Melanotaenia boesemani TaxID=1250792 RepID=UPI001C049332|nr:uncharacterized protein LOC121628035 [Melanotaenia boesemani]
MTHLVPLPKLPTSKELGLILSKEVFRLHGLPASIVSDRGPQFISRFWSEFCALLGIKVDLSSGFHPQTDGQTERANQEVQEWEARVLSAHAAAQRCYRVWRRARRALMDSSAVYSRMANRCRVPAPGYRVGQKVWLSTKDLPLWLENRKLAPRFICPFPIVRIINLVAVRLGLPHTLRVHPTFHVSRVKPVSLSPLAPSSRPPPPTRFVAGGPVYTMRRILRSWRWGRRVQYLVDWEGYGPEERSWIPSRFVVDSSLIRALHRSCRGMPAGPLGAGP